MKRRMMLLTTLFSLAATSAMGCTTERVVVQGPAPRAVVVTEQPGPDRVVAVTKRPPAPRREVRPRRLSRRHVWVGGYWSWSGHRYVWKKGHWGVPPRHGGRWVAGHWAKRGGGWVWVAGFWRY